MKNLFRLFIFTVLIASVLFVGCRKTENDTTAPDISGLAVTPASAKPGDTVTVTAKLADNAALSKVTIIRGDSLRVVEEAISGKSHELNKAIIISTGNKPGAYPITVKVVDAAGNEKVESKDVTVDAAAPEIIRMNVTPTIGGVGGKITVSGRVEDNTQVSSVKISVTINSSTGSDDDWSVTDIDAVLNEEGTNANFTKELSVPLNATPGDYTITASASNGKQTGTKTATVNVMVDDEPPVLKDFWMPEDANRGDGVQIYGSVSDNLQVTGVKLLVAINSDTSSADDWSEDIDVGLSFDDSGKNATFSVDLTVPDNATQGTYNFTFIASDGTQTTTEVKPFRVLGGDDPGEDNTPPTIISLDIYPSTAKRGDEVAVYGSAEDNVQVASATISVAINSDTNSENDWSVTDEDIEFDPGSSVSIDKTMTVPDNATLGTYTFTVKVSDAKGNTASKTVTLTVEGS